MRTTASTVLILLSVAVALAGFAPLAKAELLVGWWANIGNEGLFPTWAASGANFVHGNWIYSGYFNGAYTKAQVQYFLDKAAENGMKVSMNAKTDVPGVDGYSTAWPATAQQFTDWINLWKNHPAIWGWYLSDEPEISSNPTLAYTYLATNPGYYKLAKAADPNHYAWLVNCCPLSTAWDDVRDLYALDNYPKGSNTAEFPDSLRQSYDTWKYGLDMAKSSNKLPFIAVAQGFGAGFPGYGDLTPNELRYHVFSAIVQGIDKVLFWSYEATNPTMAGRVNQTISQIMAINKELENGVTNDSRINLSQPTSNLTYRYGANGTSNVILAVNIANRSSVNGQTLSDVQFRLPAGANATQVEVLSESRTLPVTNGVFTDSFDRFAVHVYKFISRSSSDTIPPAAPKGLRVR